VGSDDRLKMPRRSSSTPDATQMRPIYPALPSRVAHVESPPNDSRTHGGSSPGPSSSSRLGLFTRKCASPRGGMAHTLKTGGMLYQGSGAARPRAAHSRSKGNRHRFGSFRL